MQKQSCVLSIHIYLHAIRYRIHQSFCSTAIRCNQPQKPLLSIQYQCFLCCRFADQNIQPLMAALPLCRFFDTPSKIASANLGIIFFQTPYIEDTKNNLNKCYGLFFTCTVTCAAHLESYPHLKTNASLDALRRFFLQGYQPNLFMSDSGKNVCWSKQRTKLMRPYS